MSSHSESGRSSGCTAATRRSVLRLGAGAAFAGTGLSIPRPARAATKFRVLMNFYPEPTHGGYYQAQVTGLYESAGLDVEIRPGNPQINGIQLLAGGEVDVVMGSSIGAISALERGVPVIVVMPTFQFDPQVLVTRPDIGSIADLKGHKILVTTLGRGSYWLWLKDRFGFTDDQVAPYTGNFQQFIQDPTIALGGALTSEPYRIRETGTDVKYFLLAKEGYPPYGYPMIMMQDQTNRNRDAVARFVRASLEGFKSFLADPTPALRVIKAARPDATDASRADAVEKIRNFKLVDGGDAQQAGLGVMTEDRWQQLADFMLKAGILKPNTDWRAVYTTEFVKDLKITL